MICTSSVASSAVVGSSAISRSGWVSSAMAMQTRWRIPPEKLVRIDIELGAGIGHLHLFQEFHRPVAFFGSGKPVAILDVHHLLPDGRHRIQRRHRVLKDHRDALPAQSRQPWGPSWARSCPSIRIAPFAMRHCLPEARSGHRPAWTCRSRFRRRAPGSGPLGTSR